MVYIFEAEMIKPQENVYINLFLINIAENDDKEIKISQA